MQNVIFADIFGSQYLFEIYHTSLNIKNKENVVKSGFSGDLCDGEHYFFEMEECKVLCVKMFFFLDDLLESQYLCDILQILLTIKNIENVIKIECFEKSLRWIAPK